MWLVVLAMFLFALFCCWLFDIILIVSLLCLYCYYFGFRLLCGCFVLLSVLLGWLELVGWVCLFLRLYVSFGVGLLGILRLLLILCWLSVCCLFDWMFCFMVGLLIFAVGNLVMIVWLFYVCLGWVIAVYLGLLVCYFGLVVAYWLICVIVCLLDVKCELPLCVMRFELWLMRIDLQIALIIAMLRL